MGFQELPDLDCTVSTALGGVNKKTGKKNPIEVEGYYIGSRQVPSPKSKTGYAYLHVFQTAEGNLGVWGKTNLDQKLKSVVPGTMTRVTFAGMKETKNNPMYTYRVAVDTSNTIEVGAGAAAVESNEYDGGLAGDEEGALDDVAEEPVAYSKPVAPAQPAKAPSVEAQKRVQDLLRGRVNKA